MSPFIDQPCAASAREAAANESLMLRVREVVAVHFRVTLDRLTHETHLSNDLNADHFDRIELMIAIEDQVPGIEIDDVTLDGIETIGDVMRAIEGLAATALWKPSGPGAAPPGGELADVAGA
jgi:acyl carrier protein